MEHTVTKGEREKGDLLEEYKELESDYDELDKVNRKLNKELTDHMATIRLVNSDGTLHVHCFARALFCTCIVLHVHCFARTLFCTCTVLYVHCFVRALFCTCTVFYVHYFVRAQFWIQTF